MHSDGTWGSAIEIACLAHMLQLPIYVYDISDFRPTILHLL